MDAEESLKRGDRVEYVGRPVFDGIIEPGDTGRVTKVEPGWVSVFWASGEHSVPPANLRLQATLPPRQLEPSPVDPGWHLVGEILPPLPGGRERDPYMEQGSHPDCVERVWDDLGAVVPAACRAQAHGKPVLAHPITHRIFAKAHGTQYVLWLVPTDYQKALAEGAKTTMTWSGGRVTDLREEAGMGWIWGFWHRDEPIWLIRAHAEVGLPGRGQAG